MTTRNDAALYLLAGRRRCASVRTLLPRRLVLVGAVGFALGVAPLLAYNYVATGNPLRPTQAMELNSVLSRAPGASGTVVGAILPARPRPWRPTTRARPARPSRDGRRRRPGRRFACRAAASA